MKLRPGHFPLAQPRVAPKADLVEAPTVADLQKAIEWLAKNDVDDEWGAACTRVLFWLRGRQNHRAHCDAAMKLRSNAP